MMAPPLESSSHGARGIAGLVRVLNKRGSSNKRASIWSGDVRAPPKELVAQEEEPLLQWDAPREEWEDAMRRFMPQQRVLFALGPGNALRRACMRLCLWRGFYLFFLFCTLANFCTIAARDPVCEAQLGAQCFRGRLLDGFELAFTAVFSFEVVVQSIARGLFVPGGFLRSGWGYLDVAVVALGWLSLSPEVGSFGSIRTLRLFRAFRGLKRYLPAIRVLARAIGAVAPTLGHLFVQLGFFFAVYAIAGLQLFEGTMTNRCVDSLTGSLLPTSPAWPGEDSYPRHMCSLEEDSGRPCDPGSRCAGGFPLPVGGTVGFDHLGVALMTVFQAVTLSQWTMYMYWTAHATNQAIAYCYFISLVLLGAFLILNMAIAAITTKYDEIDQIEAKAARHNIGAQIVLLVRRGFWKSYRPLRVTRKASAALARSVGGRIAGSRIGRATTAVYERWRGSEARERLRRFLAARRGLVYLALVGNYFHLAVYEAPAGPTAAAIHRSLYYFFTALLGASALADLALRGGDYFASPWNLLDLAATAWSLAECAAGVQQPYGNALRIPLLLRPLAKLDPTLAVLVENAWRAVRGLLGFLPFFLVAILVLSVLGVQLFGGACVWAAACAGQAAAGERPRRAHFDDLFSAYLTVFRVITADSWNDVLADSVRATGAWAMLYFLAVFFVGLYVLLNVWQTIVIINICDNLQTAARGGAERQLDPARALAESDEEEEGEGEGEGEGKGAYSEAGAWSEGGSRSAPASKPASKLASRAASSPALRLKSLEGPPLPPDAATAFPGAIAPAEPAEEDEDAELAPPGPLLMVPLGLAEAPGAAWPERSEEDSSSSSALPRSLAALPAPSSPGAAPSPRRVRSALRSARGAGADEAEAPRSRDSASASDEAAAPAARSFAIPSGTHLRKAGGAARRGSSTSAKSAGGAPSRLRRLMGHRRSSQALLSWWDAAVARASLRLAPFTGPGSASLCCLGPGNGARRAAGALVEGRPWFALVMAAVLANAAVMGVEVSMPPGEPHRALTALNSAFTLVFALDLALKVVAHGAVLGEGAYLRSPAAWVDAAVVAASLASLQGEILALPQDKAARAVRVARSLSLLRLFARLRTARALWATLTEGGGVLLRVLLINWLLWSVFAVAAVRLFGGAMHVCSDARVTHKAACAGLALDPETGAERALEWRPVFYWQSLDNYFYAMFHLYEVAALEQWSLYREHGEDATGWETALREGARPSAALFFHVFLYAGLFSGFAMIIGTVVHFFSHARKADAEGAHEAAGELLTGPQKELYDILALAVKQRLRKKQQAPRGRLRGALYRGVQGAWFEAGVQLLVLGNTALLASLHHPRPPALDAAFEQANVYFALAFGAEMLLKLAALGPRVYLASAWERFDGAITVLGLLGLLATAVRVPFVGTNALRVLRLARILRFVRLARFVRGVQVLMTTVAHCLPALCSVGLLILLIIYVYAIVGVWLFQGVALEGAVQLSEDANFRSLPRALVTLYRMTTGENWNWIMWDHMRGPETGCVPGSPSRDCGTTWAAPLYFCSFMFVTYFVLNQLFVAVVLDAFEDVAARAEYRVSEADVEAYAWTWERQDPAASGFVHVASGLRPVLRAIGLLHADAASAGPAPPLPTARGLQKTARSLSQAGGPGRARGSMLAALRALGEVPVAGGRVHYFDLIKSLIAAALGEAGEGGGLVVAYAAARLRAALEGNAQRRRLLRDAAAAPAADRIPPSAPSAASAASPRPRLRPRPWPMPRPDPGPRPGPGPGPGRAGRRPPSRELARRAPSGASGAAGARRRRAVRAGILLGGDLEFDDLETTVLKEAPGASSRPSSDDEADAGSSKGAGPKGGEGAGAPGRAPAAAGRPELFAVPVAVAERAAPVQEEAPLPGAVFEAGVALTRF
eukprot:tig00000498_g1589.t1